MCRSALARFRAPRLEVAVSPRSPSHSQLSALRSRQRVLWACVVVSAPLLLGYVGYAAPSARSAVTTTARVSVSSSGIQANGSSDTLRGPYGPGEPPVLSADGRFIAFSSRASNLVAGDVNGHFDAFVYDRNTGRVHLVSRGRGGVQGNRNSVVDSISSDGRFVVFSSSASNLVRHDDNGVTDVFVRDRRRGITRLVSQATDGRRGNDISELGLISGDGQWVAFWSFASNLVRGDTNHTGDVLLRNRVTGRTRLVSRTSSGTLGNAISSPDAISTHGRYIEFDSAARNLGSHGHFEVYVRDQGRSRTTLVSRSAAGTPATSDANGSGLAASRYAVVTTKARLVPTDVNGFWDVYIRDLVSNTTTLVSVSSLGAQGDNSSGGPGFGQIAISSDGQRVVFSSMSTNLVAGDTNQRTDIFLRDLQAGTTSRMSVTSAGFTDPRRRLSDDLRRRPVGRIQLERGGSRKRRHE